MSKVVFQFEIDGIKRVIPDAKSLRRTLADLKNEMLQTNKATKQYEDLKKVVGQLSSIQAQNREEVRQARRDYEETNRFAAGSYRALNAELVRLRAEYKKMTPAERAIAGPATIKRVQQLDKQLKTLDSDIGNYQRNVGNYASAFKGIGKALLGGLLVGGVTEAIQRIGEFIGESITLFSEFQRQISFLGAVSGAASQQFADGTNALEALEENARKLGGTTEFTAQQVAGLQIEFAKLGFEPAEILQATADTLNLATVAQSDLGETAAVVGATIRGFNLSTTETGNVANIMGKAFSSSALDLKKFETAMAIVAPVADSAGASLEQTTALMGTLADAGVDASTIGTGLRNAFLKLNEQGLSLNDALDKIENSTDKTGAALRIFGVRGSTVGTILSNNREKVDELNDSFNSTEEFTTKAAEAIRGDLKGSFDTLNSATQEFQLTLAEGFEGAIQAGVDFLTTVIQGLTSGLSFLYDAFEPVFQALGELIGEFYNAEDAGSILDGVLNFVAGSIRVVANVLLFAIRQITGFVQGIKIAVGAVPFLSDAINFLQRSFLALFNGIGKIPAVLNGLVSVALAAQQKILDGGKKILLSAKILAKDIEGLVSDAAKAEAKALRQQRDRIGKDGASLADAFKKGFNESIVRGQQRELKLIEDAAVEEAKRVAAKSGTEIGRSLSQNTIKALERDKKELNELLSEAEFGSQEYKAIQREIIEIEKKLAEGRAKGIQTAKESTKETEKVATAYEKLTKRQTELKNEILDAQIKGEDYTKQLAELKDVSKQVSDAQAVLKDSTKDSSVEAELAIGSIAQLSEVVSDLKKELNEASPENVKDIAKALVDAEKQLKEAKEKINSALGVSGEDKSAEEAEKIRLKAVEDRIEKEKLLEIAALRDKDLTEKEFTAARKLIELDAAKEIAEEKAAIFKEGSEKQLQAAQQAADGEVAISKEKLAQIKAQRDENIALINEGLNTVQGVSNSLSEITKNNADARVSELETEYARKIELAEGNSELEEELEAELTEKRQALREEEFEKQKKLQIAAATISFAQGVINTLAAPTTIPDPAGSIFKGLKVAAFTGTYLSNLNKIKKSTFAEEGAIVDPVGRLNQIRSSISSPALGFQSGRSHNEGSNFSIVGDTLLESERGEFIDFDEYGRTVIVNKKSASKFGGALQKGKGKTWTGKARWLSDVNSYSGYGRVFAQDGAVIPSLASVGQLNQPSAGSTSVTVTLRKEDISAIAYEIGKQAKAGTKEGFKEAQEQEEIDNFRQKRLEQKLEI